MPALHTQVWRGHRTPDRYATAGSEEQSGHMNQVSVAWWPESWLPNQIVVLPYTYMFQHITCSLLSVAVDTEGDVHLLQSCKSMISSSELLA